MSSGLLADAWSERFANVVGWYATRLIRRKFHALRIVKGGRNGNGPEGLAAFADLAAERDPIMIVMNHSSWWDPMLVNALRHRLFPQRSYLIPMDRVSLERFRFLRKCGMFGIDPDDPKSLALMSDYVRKRAAELPRCTVGLTPQGQFMDVRSTVRPRPGAAAILSRNPGMRIWSLAGEYGFWQDQRPEIFLRMMEAPPPEKPTTAGWQRRLAEVMESNQRRLEDAVKSRDPASFEIILGGRGNRIHPLYDLWLRLRGKPRGIETGHRLRARDPLHGSSP